MPLGKLSTIAALALSAGLYLHHRDTSDHPHFFGPSAKVLATANLTNALVRYTHGLRSTQLQDSNLVTETLRFDEDYTTVTIDWIDEILQDAKSLSTSVDFSDCEDLLYQLHHLRPSDQLAKEEDRVRTKALAEYFVRDTASEKVWYCIRSIDDAVQQQSYLQKVHDTTSEFVGKIGNTDLLERYVLIRNRSSKLSASLTYLAIMLDFWAHETAGLREFLQDLRHVLLGEEARVAKAKGIGTRPWLFGKYIRRR
jgi:hypothetical protein